MDRVLKTKEITGTISAALTAIVLCGAALTGGIFSSGADRNITAAIAATATVLIIAAAIVNIALSKTMIKKLRAMKVREVRNMSLKLKAEIEADYAAAEKKTRATIVWSYVYIFALTAIILAAVYAYGAAAPIAASVPITVIGAALVFGLASIPFSPAETPRYDEKAYMKREDFSMLYKSAERAANKIGYKGNLKFYCRTDGVSVTEHANTAYINLGMLEAAVLTETEFYNVMLHELAHVVNADARRSRYFTAQERCWTGAHAKTFISSLTQLLFSSRCAMQIVFDTNIYMMIASKHHEIKADETVGALGDGKEYLDALAKTALLAMYRETPKRELDYDFYASEEAPLDFASRMYNLYPQYLKKYADKWLLQLERELPANNDSHPTFSMRKKALGGSDYDAFKTETNAEYRAQQLNAVKLADRLLNERNRSDYGKYREEFYIKRTETMRAFEAAESSGEAPGEALMLAAVQAYYGIDDDKALRIADRLIESTPNSYKASFFKGVILSGRCDDGCIECFKAAAVNVNLTNAAIDCIGKYAIKTGNQKLLDEYRAEVADVIQESMDKAERNKFTAETEAEKCGLDENAVKEITDAVLAAGKNGVERIYACKYTDKDDAAHYPVCIEFGKFKNIADLLEAAAAIYEALDMLSDSRDYQFFCNIYNVKEYNKIKNIDGSLIYEGAK
ncbi:MAG: M48 family metalloprotease [Christensenellales bacterium]